MKINERYAIGVGPKIIIPDYSDSGKLYEEEFNYGGLKITLVLINKENGKPKIIECVQKDVKAHTYDEYPDGQTNSQLNYQAKAYIESGIAQTGISYPCSTNSARKDAFASQNVDASVIEFVGKHLDFSPSNYVLQEICIEPLEE